MKPVDIRTLCSIVELFSYPPPGTRVTADASERRAASPPPSASRFLPPRRPN